MTILGAYMILIMLVLGGIGVDLMHNEMDRTRLQAVADRAVLAAADLDQTLEPGAVVQDYFDKSGKGDFVSSVTVDEGLNYRRVQVDASTTTPTQFMRKLGVPELHVPARAAAEEKVNKVEISLVLDVSGSMNDNQKMENLQDAAGVFVDAVLKPENDGLISVSLVPYSEHVNVGEDIFRRLRMTNPGASRTHDMSYCVEFNESDFNTTSFDFSRTYNQMQHFQWNTYSIESGYLQNTRYDTVCPRRSYETVTPFSQNADALKAQIDLLRPRAGTQIFMGMKWATAMLDPSFRPMTQSLAQGGHVDAAFANRPASYSDDETLKTIILMTDGQNSSSQRISWRYYRTDSLQAFWRSYNLNYYLNRYVYSYRHTDFYWTKYTANQGDRLLYNMCDAAKDQNVVIWTIGFEVGKHGADVMRDCASSPSHFFRVEGVDIKKAFAAVARQINQLRLIQ